jgi:hypothetical protein
MKTRLQVWVLALIWLIVGSACRKEVDTTIGTLQGTVQDAETKTGLANVRIIIFDANTNSPIGVTLLTQANGSYTTTLAPGNYYLKLYKQGYNSVPGRDMSALPFSIVGGQTLENPYRMYPSTVIDGGIISGKVTNGTAPVAGVLVVAIAGSTGHSSITDKDGNYFIYNVPAIEHSVQGWISGYNSSSVSINVAAGGNYPNTNLSLSGATSGMVSGSVTFLATTNINVDVALTHPGTHETIPGLSTTTSGGTYMIHNVPNGTYLARATYQNDGKVMDPDWIIKNGEPFVTVDNATATRNFSVTGAVSISSPSNSPDLIVPAIVTTATPTFTWSAYSSTDDYIIEVMDANGKVVWGGFSNNWQTKNIIIPKSQTSILYNADGKAQSPLYPGHVYRWKIYASKTENTLLGWKLISASEDQRGIFIIQ